MKTKTFKIGDWVFCEFKLQQIMEMKDENITDVSDGRFRHGSSSLNDRCFHLDLRIKLFSDECAYWYDRFHKECRMLNFPDMNRKMIELWANGCREIHDDVKQQEHYTKVATFGKAVIEQYEKANQGLYVDGVKLFR